MYPNQSALPLVSNRNLLGSPVKQNLWWGVKDSNLHTIVPKTIVFSMYPISVKVSLGVDPGVFLFD